MPDNPFSSVEAAREWAKNNPLDDGLPKLEESSTTFGQRLARMPLNAYRRTPFARIGQFVAQKAFPEGAKSDRGTLVGFTDPDPSDVPAWERIGTGALSIGLDPTFWAAGGVGNLAGRAVAGHLGKAALTTAVGRGAVGVAAGASMLGAHTAVTNPFEQLADVDWIVSHPDGDSRFKDENAARAYADSLRSKGHGDVTIRAPGQYSFGEHLKRTLLSTATGAVAMGAGGAVAGPLQGIGRKALATGVEGVGFAGTEPLITEGRAPTLGEIGEAVGTLGVVKGMGRLRPMARLADASQRGIPIDQQYTAPEGYKTRYKPFKTEDGWEVDGKKLEDQRAAIVEADKLNIEVAGDAVPQVNPFKVDVPAEEARPGVAGAEKSARKARMNAYNRLYRTQADIVKSVRGSQKDRTANSKALGEIIAEYEADPSKFTLYQIEKLQQYDIINDKITAEDYDIPTFGRYRAPKKGATAEPLPVEPKQAAEQAPATQAQGTPIGKVIELVEAKAKDKATTPEQRKRLNVAVKNLKMLKDAGQTEVGAADAAKVLPGSEQRVVEAPVPLVESDFVPVSEAIGAHSRISAATEGHLPPKDKTHGKFAQKLIVMEQQGTSHVPREMMPAEAPVAPPAPAPEAKPKAEPKATTRAAEQAVEDTVPEPVEVKKKRKPKDRKSRVKEIVEVIEQEPENHTAEETRAARNLRSSEQSPQAAAKVRKTKAVPIEAGALGMGDTLEIAGQEYRVTDIDATTGEVYMTGPSGRITVSASGWQPGDVISISGRKMTILRSMGNGVFKVTPDGKTVFNAKLTTSSKPVLADKGTYRPAVIGSVSELADAELNAHLRDRGLSTKGKRGAKQKRLGKSMEGDEGVSLMGAGPHPAGLGRSLEMMEDTLVSGVKTVAHGAASLVPGFKPLSKKWVDWVHEGRQIRERTAMQRGERGMARLIATERANELTEALGEKASDVNLDRIDMAVMGKYPLELIPKVARDWVVRTREIIDADSIELRKLIGDSFGTDSELYKSVTKNLGEYLHEFLSVRSRENLRGMRRNRIDYSQFMKKKDRTEAERIEMEFERDTRIRWARTHMGMRHNIGMLRAGLALHPKAVSVPDGLANAGPGAVRAWANNEGLVKVNGSLKEAGVLFGKYLPKRIGNDFNGLVTETASGGIDAVLKGYLKAWKAGKVILNPATHLRNVWGNVFFFAPLADMNPANPANLKYIRRAITDLRSRGKHYRNLLENGVIGGEYFGNELKELETRLPENASAMDMMMALVKVGYNKVGAWYNAQDIVFKIASDMKYHDVGHRGRILQGKESAREVNRWYPNYAELPPWTKKWSQGLLGHPFIAFNVSAAQILGRAAMEKPLRLAFAYALPALVNEGVEMFLRGGGYDGENLTDDEMDMVNENRPASSLISPVRNKRGGIQVFDLTWNTIFAHEVMELANAFTGERSGIVRLPAAFAHPLLSTITDWRYNKQWNGAPIYHESDTGRQKATKVFQYFGKQLLPLPSFIIHGTGVPVLSGEGRIGKAMNKTTDESVLNAIGGALLGLSFRQPYVDRGDAHERLRNVALQQPLVRQFLDGYLGGQFMEVPLELFERDLMASSRFHDLLQVYNESYRAMGGRTEVSPLSEKTVIQSLGMRVRRMYEYDARFRELTNKKVAENYGDEDMTVQERRELQRFLDENKNVIAITAKMEDPELTREEWMLAFNARDKILQRINPGEEAELELPTGLYDQVTGDREKLRRNRPVMSPSMGP